MIAWLCHLATLLAWLCSLLDLSYLSSRSWLDSALRLLPRCASFLARSDRHRLGFPRKGERGAAAFGISLACNRRCVCSASQGFGLHCIWLERVSSIFYDRYIETRVCMHVNDYTQL